jgi:ABC-type transport system involved in cytochrome bd biosynthesis fused ATPase/permease subunit
VTHGLRWLPYVDNIIVMVNGTVVETGTYDDLILFIGETDFPSATSGL